MNGAKMCIWYQEKADLWLFLLLFKSYHLIKSYAMYSATRQNPVCVTFWNNANSIVTEKLIICEGNYETS